MRGDIMHDYVYAAIVLIPLLALLAGSILWSWSLRRQVARRTIGWDTEIAEHKRAEERIKHLNNVLRAIRNVNQLITKEKDRDKLITRACELLVETRGYDSAWLVLLDENQKPVKSAQAGLGDEFTVLLEQMEDKVFYECSRRALKQPGVVAIDDPKSCCGDCPLLGQQPDFGALTIRLEHGGRIFGLLSVEIPVRLAFDEEEQELFKEVAGDIAFALHAIEVEEDRKRAEEALREERDFAQNLVNTAQAIILVLDVEGRIVRFNPYMEALSGYSLAEVQGQDWFSTFLPAQDHSRIRALFQEAVGDIETRGNVNPIVTKDGRDRQIEWYDKTLKDAAGNVEGVLAVGQDITERVQAEEALRESEERYRMLFERTANPVLVIDTEGNYVGCNEAALKFVECTRDELLTKNVRDFVPPGKERQALGEHEPLWDSGGIVETEYYVHDEVKILELTITPAMWRGKRVVLGVGTDITERRRAEEALRQSEERFRLAFENANIGMCLVDLDGRLTRVNSQMCEMFGYSQEELESMTINDIAHPEDLDTSPRFIQGALSGEIDHTQFEKRYFHK